MLTLDACVVIFRIIEVNLQPKLTVNRSIKYIIKKLVLPVFSFVSLQPLFLLFHRCSLAAMNIGIGSDVESSGELYVMRYVARQLKSVHRPVIFDVGANVGKWTLAASNIFPTGSFFHCFEPSAVTCKILLKNIEGKCEYQVHCSGLGDCESILSLFRPEQSSVASLYQRVGYNELYSETTIKESVSIKRLDAICKELKLEHIDFIKFDIEGHELAALRGCTDMLNKGAIAFVQFEFGGCNIESRTFFRDFWDMLSSNYRIFRVLPLGLYEVKQYGEWMEQFTTTNFLAVYKGQNRGKIIIDNF